MDNRQLIRSTVVTALVPIIFYGVAFTWGTVYHQTRLEIWGLPTSLFPLSSQMTYLEAVMPASTAATAPVTWADAVFGSWLSLLIVAIISATMLASYLYTGSRLETWLETRRAALPRELSSTEKRMIRWASWPFLIITGPLALSLAVTLILLLLIAPPYFAARHDGERAWLQQEYLTWPEVTWADENGQLRKGYLARCSSPWCGIVTAEGAEVVDTAKIKRIVKQRNLPSSTSPK